MTMIAKLSLRLFSGLCALLAGALNLASCSMYGPPVTLDYGIPPPPHEPGVVIEDFSYTPATEINPGDRLTLSVTANKPFDPLAASVHIVIGTEEDPVLGVPAGVIHGYPHDDGIAPDETAADGVYTGLAQIPPFAEIQQDIPIVATLRWLDGYEKLTIQGEPLDIVEPPAEQQ